MTWILFFDGDCAFCSRSCRWVARHDKHRRIELAPLQGELSRAHGFERFADGPKGTLVIQRESDGRQFLRSDAVIELGRALGGIYGLTCLLKLIPRRLRDHVYSLVARNRHLIPGGALQCVLHDPEVEKRLRR
jgi:predicted DCC family thiol-disulfide oxidoreductase YuxK